MSQQGRKEGSPAYKWEQALIDDYHNYRWHRLMEPLCDKLQRWKAGQVSHEEMDQFMEEVYLQICEARNLFRQRRDRLVNLIQWWDREWFLEWIKGYSPPPGVEVLPGPSEPTDES